MLNGVFEVLGAAANEILVYVDDLEADFDCDSLARDTKDVRCLYFEETLVPIHFGSLMVNAADSHESGEAILL